MKNVGFTAKKVVITTERFLLFEALSNRLQETEYELTSVIAKKAAKSNIEEKKYRISVCGLP